MEQPISNFCGLDLEHMPSITRGQARVHRVPLHAATPHTLAGLGHLVEAFDDARVEITPWPVAGWRKLVAGTGAEGGVVEDCFEMHRSGELQIAENHAVQRRYVTGWFADPATARETVQTTDTSRLYTHEANYHPDGGQIFFPRSNAAFVALLAPPGDDVTPESFVAFYFDGSAGVHINAGVWHQPVFPTRASATFDDRQGRVHACVSCSFVEEFGCYLEVPLSLES